MNLYHDIILLSSAKESWHFNVRPFPRALPLLPITVSDVIRTLWENWFCGSSRSKNKKPKRWTFVYFNLGCKMWYMTEFSWKIFLLSTIINVNVIWHILFIFQTKALLVYICPCNAPPWGCTIPWPWGLQSQVQFHQQ